MKFIGLDAGSVSVKLVLLDENGKCLQSFYTRHRGRPLIVALELLKEVSGANGKVPNNNTASRLTPDPSLPGPDFSLSVTGSAGRLIGNILGIEPVNEVVANTYSTRRLYPDIRTIIEIGGEDAKLIIIDEDSNSARDFSMNSVCAAGTGSFLDQQAERLRLSIEEFSELSLRSKNPPRIAGRCSVFAKSDMIHLQQIATPVEDIVAGLCFAVARNFKGSISRGRDIVLPVSFQGGVAANAGMVRAFREVMGFDKLFVPGEYALMGALGAVFKDMDSGKVNPFELSKLSDFISEERPAEQGHRPLLTDGDEFMTRHPSESQKSVSFGDPPGREVRSQNLKENNTLNNSAFCTLHSDLKIRAFLGVDIGSISTNLAVIDEDCRLLAKRYLMTAGRPIEAVKQGLEEIGEEVGNRVEIMGVGTTGSGRYMIADYIGADIVKNEITAQATAAAFIDGDVDTIFEIGGQDSKFISLKNGVIVDFEMNKACAAGTGSFLEEQAEKLDISIKNEFETTAFQSKNPCRLGERCTVFMENSLMANLQRGVSRENLLAGLSYSIVQNYINRVVGKRTIGDRIFFQGGVAFNKSVVAAFEKYLDKQITVPPDHDVTGAIGMALIAKKHMESQKSEVRTQKSETAESKRKASSLSFPLVGNLSSEGLRTSRNDGTKAECGTTGRVMNEPDFRTRFKGFELARRPYEQSSFECKGCPNVCEINRVKVEGEKGFLFYGGRCEKYDVRKKEKGYGIPDLFAFRDEMLWKEHLKRKSEVSLRRRPAGAGSRKLEINGENPENSAFCNLNSEFSKFGRIGIPNIFYFQDFLPYWTTLLWELGFEVEVSPRTDRKIVDLGLESVLSETCFPVKTAHGHVRHLLEAGIETIFIPSFVNMNDPDHAFERGFACPYTQTIPYSAGVAFKGVKFLAPVIDLNRGNRFIMKELKRVFRPFNIPGSRITRAMEAGRIAQEEFSRTIRERGKEILSSRDERMVVIVGRAYNSFDRGMNLNIPQKLADLGVLSLPMDFLPLENEDIDKDWPNMYWRAGQRILGAARIIRSNPLLHAVYIGNFSCGPDSFILKFFEEEMSGKPYLHLEIDAHSADAGAITRCEAFLDSIQNKVQSSKFEVTHAETKNLKQKTQNLKRRTIYIPRMSDHSFALAAAFEYCGVQAEVLPESSQDTVDLGRKFVSGKECYPCAVTTGDMVKKINSAGFDPGRAAFFMPSGSGPCRFGQYNVFHRRVVRELGYDDIPIFSPNQDENFYEHLGIVGRDFTMKSWRGILAIEFLNKCLHETRPYEEEKGASDALHDDYLSRIYQSVKGTDGKLDPLLKRIRRDFENIRRMQEKKPLIGIVGEIFVRSNRFSNEDLIRKIESLGGEAYLAPVEEWIYYINAMGLRRVLIKKDWSGIINLLLRRFFQKRVERSFAGHFEGFLRTLHEPDTKELLEKASAYIHSSFEGEAVLSIGKSVDLISRGASGLVNAMPFGCMPGTIVNGLMRGLNRDYDIPCLSIPYDGSESLTTEIQLEAFIDQAKEHQKKQLAAQTTAKHSH